jgi:hypothetical protein
MTITCPRCASPSSRWEKRCNACWLPFDASLSMGARLPIDHIKSSTADRQRQPVDAALGSLGDMLGIDAEHVLALAAGDIRTLEHVAQALPETIEHVLRVCTRIDPGALIARARQQLQTAETSKQEDPEPPEPAEPSVSEPNLDEWWKMR